MFIKNGDGGKLLSVISADEKEINELIPCALCGQMYNKKLIDCPHCGGKDANRRADK
jgi:rRNA maturation endonuclease Nob1